MNDRFQKAVHDLLKYGSILWLDLPVCHALTSICVATLFVELHEGLAERSLLVGFAEGVYAEAHDLLDLVWSVQPLQAVALLTGGQIVLECVGSIGENRGIGHKPHHRISIAKAFIVYQKKFLAFMQKFLAFMQSDLICCNHKGVL